MLQVASLMPATKSKTEVRALGARERMFWFMDQKHPVHLTVTAEVKGITKVQSWRDALDAVQKRHPILSTSIKRNEEGQPALYQVDAAPIPLRVVDGSAQERWELELDREMALPFTPEQAPLIRSVLIHKPQSAVLIMVAHHSIADGMALVFLIRDLLQVLSGGQIEALSFSSTAEELLSKLPKGEKIVPAEASQAGVAPAEPAVYREADGLAPRATARKLDEHLTAALKDRARREGTTVQGALCAALALAGRKTSSAWRKQSVRVMSPVNVRAHLRVGLAAPLLLLSMRVLQGVAIGGEAPGAWVFVAEHARRGRVGFAVGLLTSGLSCGILLGSLVATGVNMAFSQTQIAGGLWRLPFVIGGVFGFVAMLLRRWLEETPVFEEMRRRAAMSRELPLRAVLRSHGRAIFIS